MTHSISELINYESGCRTAQATSGLTLNNMYRLTLCSTSLVYLKKRKKC